MQTVNSVASLRAQVKSWRGQGLVVAFVPTMGNLHDGHIELVKHAKTRADKVIASIFVNPMQFGANEDLDKYPRTLEADQQRLIAVETDLLFAPAVDEMYPSGMGVQTVVSVPGITDILCGASRPGHFDGVSTVVTKLFNQVQPDIAVFGKKDYQQLAVIRKMVVDLCMPVEIVGVDTQREASGLALSSRNGYLSAEEKKQAVTLYATLNFVAESLESAAPQAIQAVLDQAVARLQGANFKVDYLEIRRSADLQPPTDDDKSLIVLAAAFMGSTRLIDNLEFNLHECH